MSDEVMSNASAFDISNGVQNSVQDVTAPVSYGARLALQRQSAGLSVTDVAAHLRLHPNQVRAIEQEDLAGLPAPAYVRGFIRSYARMLKIDPAPLLSDLNAKLEPVRESVVEDAATHHSAARAASRDQKLPQWMLSGALLLLITLGVVGWQARLEQSPAPTPVAVAVTPAAPPAPIEPAVVTSQASVSEAPAIEVKAGEAAASPAAADPVPAPADTAEPTVASSAIASGAAPTLVLRFNGASWAEVTDRGGKILLSQLNSEGAEHALDGDLPLTVVIGDANFASVEVRGVAFNLQPFTRNNVARFTIK